MTPTDKMRTRLVRKQLKLVREHLEAMQRDVHGLEYAPWKLEVDGLWRRIFHQIECMSASPQQASLQMIREPWTMYLTHYVATSG